MRTPYKFAVFFLVVFLFSGAAWKLACFREPVYEGKRLSEWLQGYITPGSYIAVEPDEQTDRAVRQIGTNAIPTLLRMLSTRDSVLRRLLGRMTLRQDIVKIHVLPAYFPTAEAATAFRVLGASASNAVPDLIRIYRLRAGPDSQRACVEALGWMGPASAAALPDVLDATTNSDYSVRPSAIATLARIHADPELVLPVLIQSLRDENVPVCSATQRALEEYAPRSKLAAAALTHLLDDRDPHVRIMAGYILKSIDPKPSVEAGVK